MSYINTMPRILDQLMIKFWSEPENRWIPSYYYYKPSMLPRTIGYMYQEDIDNLPTKDEVVRKIFRAKL